MDDKVVHPQGVVVPVAGERIPARIGECSKCGKEGLCLPCVWRRRDQTDRSVTVTTPV